MQPLKTHFTLHSHYRKSQHREHWDLRIRNPSKRTVWSFAIPKSKFPTHGEKLLLIKTPDHPLSSMDLEGTLKNSGDEMKIIDRGECILVKNTDTQMMIVFHGETIKGLYSFIKIRNDNWLLIGGSNVVTSK